MRRVADPQATPVGNLPVRPGLAGFRLVLRLVMGAIDEELGRAFAGALLAGHLDGDFQEALAALLGQC